MQTVDVAIIGAGSAGLSALRQVKKYTENFVMINHGFLGTKCARIGCMPSKALIIIANDYHRCDVFNDEGIAGVDQLKINIPGVLQHVRSLRDRLTNGMIKVTKQQAGDRLIEGHAEIIGPELIRVNNKEIRADKIILATGSRPLIPAEWQKFSDKILTSDTIFEQYDLPKRIGIIGLGPVGLEIGQALGRLGINVTGFSIKQEIASITDPEIKKESVRIFKKEFPVYLGSPVDLADKNGTLTINHPEIEVPVDAVLVAIGIEPDIRSLGLENLNLQLDKNGTPLFDANTSQIGDLSIFIAGDINGCRPILHEALDEGFIAGHNSVSQEIISYSRRTPLRIVFSDPQIATAGLSYEELKKSEKSFITGQVNFADQSRAMLELRNHGRIHIYADIESARVLGAELICPQAEHLSQQLALSIQNKLTVFDILQAPFYHPTVEEGLRSALRNVAKKLPDKTGMHELSLCDSCPEEPLC